MYESKNLKITRGFDNKPEISFRDEVYVFVFEGRECFMMVDEYNNMTLIKDYLNDDEDELYAAKRIFESYIGIEVNGLHSFGVLETAKGKMNKRIHLFKSAYINRAVTKDRVINEKIRITKIDIGEIVKMIHRNEITDADTVAAVGKYLIEQSMTLYNNFGSDGKLPYNR